MTTVVSIPGDTVQLDLAAIPFRDWPADCQQTARALLANPSQHRQFVALFPELRRGWIAAQVARSINTRWDLL